MNLMNLYSFPDPANFMSTNMILVHNSIMEIMMMILMILMYMIMMMMVNKKMNKQINSNNLIEIIWTIIPMIMLIYMAMPSIQLLYLTEVPITPNMTIKAIGNQWFWTYEYSDFKKDFESYIKHINQDDDEMYFLRLMDTDNRTILPMNLNIRILTSASDVIHSWTIPQMAIKMDAVPGRINQLLTKLQLPGMFFGQCSEMCGTNHSFMPIAVESINPKKFISWIMNL